MSLPALIPAGADARLLVVADHASNAVPDGIDLGVPPEVMGTHIAVDIGAGDLARAIAAAFAAPALIATVSRLVIDLNRDPDAPGLIPEISDGQAVPGNARLSAEERARRIATWHIPYHAALAAELDRVRPALIVAVHSFTPALAARPEELRPWEIGILHNRDSRAAMVAIAALRARGLKVGDNEPYSGQVLNYTMDRHAEARGLPYLGLEIRQDLLLTPAQVTTWRDTLMPVIRDVLAALG